MHNSEIVELRPFDSMKSAKCYKTIEEISHSEKLDIYRAEYVSPEPKELFGKFLIIKIFKGVIDNIICLTRDIERSNYSHHNNVTKIYGSFVEKGQLWVVMKSNHVSSLNRIVANKFRRDRKGLPERMMGFVLREALMGLNHLHSRMWMHKNFDLWHIFVDSDDVVRIDFDSLAYDPDNKIKDSEPVEWPAPPPEMFTNDGLDLKSDVWCFGIAALKLAIGYIPARSYEQLFDFIAKWPERLEREAAEEEKKKVTKQGKSGRRLGCFSGRLPEEAEEKVDGVLSDAFVKMVTECLRPEQWKRPTTKQLLSEFEFFRNFHGEKPPSFIESLVG